MTIKQIIATIGTGAIITSGIVVGFKKPEKLTYSEYQTLLKVYNYEIQQAGGHIDIESLNGDLFQKINQKIKDTPVGQPVRLDNEILTPADYKLLRSGLIKKSEQKTLIQDAIKF